MWEIDLERKMHLKFKRNVQFSSFMKFPILNSRISYIKNDRLPRGGVNRPSNCLIFFSGLFRTFVHKIKNGTWILKIRHFLVRPKCSLGLCFNMNMNNVTLVCIVQWICSIQKALLHFYNKSLISRHTPQKKSCWMIEECVVHGSF